jgi:hypothetical protein
MTAVFLITAVAAIAAVMVTTLTATSVSTAGGLRAERAFFAAQSGLEVAIDAVLTSSGNCGTYDDAYSLTIEGFSVDIDCSVQSGLDEGEGTYDVFTITARAAQGSIGDGTLVSRRLRVMVDNG